MGEDLRHCYTFEGSHCGTCRLPRSTPVTGCDEHDALAFATAILVRNAAALDDSPESELEAWRERAETAEADLADCMRDAERLTRINRRLEVRLARVREFADRLCAEPHPTHDHLCPDDLRRRLLATLDDQEANRDR